MGALELVDSIVFDVQMSVFDRFSNQYYDKEEAETLYYFVDQHTAKKIKVYNRKGEKLANIPLDILQAQRYTISNLTFFSLDTIAILCNYNSLLLFMDRHGSVWKTINVDDYASQDGSNYMISAFKEMKLSDDEIVLQQFWMNYLEGGRKREATADFMKYMHSNAWRRPALIKLSNIFSDSIKYQRGFSFVSAAIPSRFGIVLHTACAIHYT